LTRRRAYPTSAQARSGKPVPKEDKMAQEKKEYTRYEKIEYYSSLKQIAHDKIKYWEGRIKIYQEKLDVLKDDEKYQDWTERVTKQISNK
jgi:hypothetical protein